MLTNSLMLGLDSVVEGLRAPGDSVLAGEEDDSC